MELWDPADFKTALEKPKGCSFLGDINKNATDQFFLGHPVSQMIKSMFLYFQTLYALTYSKTFLIHVNETKQGAEAEVFHN